jgi:hypothetical protein
VTAWLFVVLAFVNALVGEPVGVTVAITGAIIFTHLDRQETP